jgi:hypothetical protein
LVGELFSEHGQPERVQPGKTILYGQGNQAIKEELQ